MFTTSGVTELSFQTTKTLVVAGFTSFVVLGVQIKQLKLNDAAANLPAEQYASLSRDFPSLEVLDIYVPDTFTFDRLHFTHLREIKAVAHNDTRLNALVGILTMMREGRLSALCKIAMQGLDAPVFGMPRTRSSDPRWLDGVRMAKEDFSFVKEEGYRDIALEMGATKIYSDMYRFTCSK